MRIATEHPFRRARRFSFGAGAMLCMGAWGCVRATSIAADGSLGGHGWCERERYMIPDRWSSGYYAQGSGQDSGTIVIESPSLVQRRPDADLRGTFTTMLFDSTNSLRVSEQWSFNGLRETLFGLRSSRNRMSIDAMLGVGPHLVSDTIAVTVGEKPSRISFIVSGQHDHQWLRLSVFRSSPTGLSGRWEPIQGTSLTYLTRTDQGGKFCMIRVKIDTL